MMAYWPDFEVYSVAKKAVTQDFWEPKTLQIET